MPFTSERKRMSIILYDEEEGVYKHYAKGADTDMFKRMKECPANDHIKPAIDEFLANSSQKGFRTLVMGLKTMTKEEVDSYLKEKKEAEEHDTRKEELLQALYDKYETDFELIGATAVEDRLQDEVPETIQCFKDAGIHVWMLTGDKLETAKNIGFSCRLLHRDMELWVLKSAEDVESICTQEWRNTNGQLMKQGKKRAIVIESHAYQAVKERKDT